MIHFEGGTMKAIRLTTLAAGLVLAWLAGGASAQISDNVIKIGVLSDMSSLYTDLAGAGAVVAARMAVEDSGIEKRGYKVEIVSADHQNKPDVGSAIARQWYDQDNVDVIVDTPNSGAALERDTGAAVTKAGGKVVGGVKAPLNSQDFSSFLLQAQASKAKVIGLA